jgi:hypothetical protein
VVTPNVGARVVLGPELVAPPHPCHVARCLRLQAAARPSAVHRARPVELTPGARMIARAPRGRRDRVANAPRCKVKRSDTRLDEPHRGLVRAIIITPWRQRDCFVAGRAVAVAPSRRTRRHRNQRHTCRRGWQTPEL